MGLLVTYPDSKSIIKSNIVTGVWCEPKPELIAGRIKKWAETAEVETVRVPGYWYTSPLSRVPADAPAQPGEKIFYHLHGGAYVMETASPSSRLTPVVMKLLEETNTMNRLFSLEYRVSSSAHFRVANPFPAALIDAVTGYNYLISELGFEPNNIIIFGDSAGGHLALSLLRYLVESSVLPMPGAFIGHSPLCDITSSHLAIPDSSLKFETDILTRLDQGFLEWAWKSFSGPLHEDPIDGPTKNPYLSPASIGPDIEATISFEGFPKTLLIYGGAERMRDDVRTLKERMVRDLGEEKVTAFEAPDAIHVFLLLEWHEPERTEGFGLISRWVDKE